MTVIIAVSSLFLLIDQLSKYYISKLLFLGESFPLVEDLFQLTLVHNPGGAFGLFRGASPLFFIIASVLTLILLFIFWKNLLGKDLSGRIGLGLVVGGALGNLLDRLRFGYVIDFLHLSLRGYHWPIFNFADVGISAGIIILGYKMLKKKTL